MRATAATEMMINPGINIQNKTTLSPLPIPPSSTPPPALRATVPSMNICRKLPVAWKTSKRSRKCPSEAPSYFKRGLNLAEMSNVAPPTPGVCDAL